MRRQRSIRNRARRKGKEVLDIDITSLLDILVIMLVFLLKSYNSSGVILNIPKSVSLPNSVSKQINSTGVNVQISPENIWVDDKEILKVSDLSDPKVARATYDMGKRRIVPLYNELVKKRKFVERIHKSTKNAQPFTGVVNLIVDKSLRYSLLKKAMFTAAEAGYMKYKFVVLSDEQ